MTLAIFKESGTIPVENDKLQARLAKYFYLIGLLTFGVPQVFDENFNFFNFF